MSDLFARPGTTSDAVADIFINRLSVDAIRAKYTAGEYGKPGPRAEHMRGWIGLRGG